VRELSKEVRVESNKSSKKSLLIGRNRSNMQKDSSSKGFNTSRFSKNPLDRSLDSELVKNSVFGNPKSSVPEKIS
jgi:hypothetical protein